MIRGVIISFADKPTESLFRRSRVKRFPRDLQRAALRKLLILDAAVTLGDLRSPPGNRLEALRGDRAGPYSIRINDQWRICFTWRDSHVHDVAITDYH
jgi:proteic killer suppression protein